MEHNTPENNSQRVVYTYDPQELHSGKSGKRKGGSSVKKGILIILLIAAIVVLAGVAINLSGFSAGSLLGGRNGADAYEFDEDYIGVLKIHGTIGEDSDTYNQRWLLERISQMKNDEKNKGLILCVNTPGGAVYESDELYLAIEDYKTANKPVYSYMESMAASGGYYISAPCDKIIANRNCWTGSIGVTIGTLYDISGLLEKAGIKTVTITSGENKAMGSSVEPLTKEQKQIFQSLVDEAYEQFVGIVAEGRDMKIRDVKKIADGRIYTAAQAKKIGLVDEIGLPGDAASDMMSTYKLQGCTVKEIVYEPDFSWKSILNMITDAKKSEASGEYEQLMQLMEENNKFTVTYLSQARK